MNGSGVLVADCGYESLKNLVWRIPVKCLAGPVIHQVSNRVQCMLVVHAQVCAFWQELAQQAVGVLTATFLPRTVVIAKVHPHPSSCCQFLVACYLFTLVVGQRLGHGLGNLTQLIGKRRQRTLSRCVRRLAQEHQPRGALDQHAHSRLVARAFDQVTHPVARNQAIGHLGRAHMDGDHVGDLTTSIVSRRTRTAHALALPQQRDELAAQLHAGVGVDGGVDAFVAGVDGRIMGVHAFECAGNLLRRPIPAQHGPDQVPQAATAVQLVKWPGIDAPLPALTLSRRAGVAAIAPQLANDGAGTAPLQLGNSPDAPALLAQRGQRHSLFRLQLRVCRSHLRTLPVVGCCTSDLRPHQLLSSNSRR